MALQLTLRTWEDAPRAMYWYAVDEFPDVRIGIPEDVLIDARDHKAIVMQALLVLRDELEGRAGERILTKGDVRHLALLAENP